MPFFRVFLLRLKISSVLVFATLLLGAPEILLLSTVGARLANAQQSSPSSQPPDARPREPPVPALTYDKAIFLKPIPSDQLAFLSQFTGVATKDVIRDKQFHKLMNGIMPDCTFHYGSDMPLSFAMEMVLKGSPEQARIRDGRYFMISGQSGPYLLGRGFLWIDMQDGITLGGFYFHPTNGEPTPSVNIFSRQVKEQYLTMGQLPPAFGQDFARWAQESRVPPVTTRYFINDSHKKIVLEHDEDYCANADGTIAPADSGCEQMNADAADIDMDAAYYLDQTHHATNSTAWMITGQDQVAWLQVRANTCGLGADPLGCRIRMTRERTTMIIKRNPAPHPIHK